MDAKKRQYYNQTSYVSGSTARKLSVAPERDYNRYEEPLRREPRAPQRTPNNQPQRRPGRKPRVTRGIDFISMTFLTLAIVATLYSCFSYLESQSKDMQLDKEIVKLTNQLTKLKDKNDAVEASIRPEVDLNEVYRIAVSELGMVHPNHNEIIPYEDSETGYVRQHKNIPDAETGSLLDRILP